MPTLSSSGKSAVFLTESALTSHGSSMSNKKQSDGRGISDNDLTCTKETPLTNLTWISNVIGRGLFYVQWSRSKRWFFGLLILEELLTITVKTFFRFVDIGGIADHHCVNFLLVCWYWRNCWPSLCKLSFGLLILVELSIITVKTFFWFVDIGGIIDHHC